MIKRMIVQFSIALFIIMSQSALAGASGLLFNVSATGTPANVSITLCLNGKGALSRQTYNVSALTLSISTVAPNHVYPFTGIKINTPGYSLGNLGLDCTPNANGYCLFSVSNSQEKTISLVVSGGLSITPTTLPQATINTFYSQTVTASGGVAPYTYAISSGLLPTGLSLNASTGLISGTPTISNTYAFTVTSTDSNYPSTHVGSQSYSMIIPPLYFSGIEIYLSASNVTGGGFTQCFSETYAVPLGNSASTAITSSCSQAVLLVACRPVGSNTLTDAAMANSTDIFTRDSPGGSHSANGTQWYNTDTRSFGYAPLGATINLNQCDYGTQLQEDKRLCWHSSAGVGGYRCGSTVGLNSSTSWERVVYQRPGPLF